MTPAGNQTATVPRLAITPGEPAGIGPDIVVKLLQQTQNAELVIFADPALLLERARLLGLPLTVVEFNPAQAPIVHPASVACVSPIRLQEKVVAGSANPKNVAYVLDTLTAALESCLAHVCDGLVTGPVHKGLVNAAGFPFSGHTEFLAEKTGCPVPVMMLATEGLRIALATTHLPLKDVPNAITGDLLRQVLRVLDRDLRRYFSCDTPNIFVCGLNPHAGDAGALGREEIEIMTPVIEALRLEKMCVQGPYSADTIFSPANMATADVFLAMYHDQGLPVLKFKGFSNAVNITLGLDIIRTSVDHGTAFDLAGTGKADTHSLQLAIGTAIDMCKHKKIPGNR